MGADRGRGPRLAFYGAMTMLAREIRRHLESEGFPASSVSLYDAGAGEGAVTDFEGEPLIVSRAEELTVVESDLAFVCGDDDPRSRDYVDWALRSGGVALDLAGV